MSEAVTMRPVGDDAPALRKTGSPLSTAAWYGDLSLDLAFPASWSVVVHYPDLPAPLTPEEMLAAVRAPVGAPELTSVAAGVRRVVIIVDDLTRPTPAHVVLPLILTELDLAGVTRDKVTVLIATGTHGPAPIEAIHRKLGGAAEGCRLIAHDDLGDCPKVGVTRLGTPVYVDREVLSAGLVIGLGGVYPQHSTGFGGGSKLALGVLGRASIARLHFGHTGMDGRYDVDNDFRADLAEIARMVGLRWMVMVHVDPRRQIVRLVSGDPELAYPAAAAFSRARYAAPMPGDADVVISNAYPMDTSATFMRSKGVIPLLHARPGASRVLLAACPEGVGHHGLFPLEPPTGTAYLRRSLDLIRARGSREVLRLGKAVVRRLFRAGAATGSGPPVVPILMYQTVDPRTALPDSLPGIRIVPTWATLLDAIRAQHDGRDDLRVVIYPCAPLQVFEP